MPRGKPAKTLAEHKAAGTYRKDRHKVLEAPPPPAAQNYEPPSDLPKHLHETWRTIIADLRAMGTVSRTDLSILELAFGHLRNAERIQALFDEKINDAETTTSDVGKLQSALASATSAHSKLIADIARQVKLRPAPPSTDWLDEM